MTTQAPVRTRWMGVGSSTDHDARAATTASVAASTQGREPALVILFVAPTYDLSAVASAAQDAVGADVPVVGCTTSGEIAGDRAGSGHVVAIALGGLAVSTSVGVLADGPREAGRVAAQGLAEIDRPHRALMLLSDGLAGARAEVVRGAYGVAGAGVPLVGGCAGDELAMEATFQLHRGEVLTGAVVGVALGSDAPIGVGIGHGWRRFGAPVVVTESDGQRLHTLDDEPALDFYLRAVGAPEEAFTSPDSWRHIALRHPIGLTRPGGEEVRAVLGADYESRSLYCGDVPQGTVISMMRGDADSVAEGTHTACESAVESLDGHPVVGLVAFDCAARRAILGDEGLRTEMASIAGHHPDVPVAGFYTYGEFARTRGARGIHNATLVLLAFA